MTASDPSTALFINTIELKKASLTFRAINNKVRLNIIRLLHQKERLAVTEIYKRLKLVQAAASQHLAILRKVNLVQAQKEGKRVFYSVNYDKLNELHSIAYQLLEKK